MNTTDYNRYLSAIKTANDTQDLAALQQIQKQLIARYGVGDEDVGALLQQFRFYV